MSDPKFFPPPFEDPTPERGPAQRVAILEKGATVLSVAPDFDTGEMVIVVRRADGTTTEERAKPR